MSGDNQSLSFLDVISIVAFLVGLANYNENVNQGQMQDAINEAVNNVHDHLKAQDKKIDQMLLLLEKENA